jgi:hypothetical protein
MNFTKMIHLVLDIRKCIEAGHLVREQRLLTCQSWLPATHQIGRGAKDVNKAGATIRSQPLRGTCIHSSTYAKGHDLYRAREASRQSIPSFALAGLERRTR